MSFGGRDGDGGFGMTFDQIGCLTLGQLELLAKHGRDIEFQPWAQDREVEIAFHEAMERYAGIPSPAEFQPIDDLRSIEAYRADMAARRKYFTGKDEL